MNMGLCFGFRLEQKLVYKPHTPIENPELTEEAKGHESDLTSVIAKGKLSPHEKMLHVESALLSAWEFSEDWKRYLDSPLISHIDAALRLKSEYDAVVGIKNAGIAYTKLFEMAGFPTFEIDYSHYKRKMDSPKMDESHLEAIKDWPTIK